MSWCLATRHHNPTPGAAPTRHCATDPQGDARDADPSVHTHTNIQGKKLTSVKICVDVVLEEGSGAEVNQLEHLPALSVCGDEEILVLDVSVDDPRSVALAHHVHHLAEEVPRLGLGDGLALRDVVKEVLHILGPLHYDDEAISVFEPVDELDNARDVAHLSQQADLQWHLLAVNLGRKKDTRQPGVSSRAVESRAVPASQTDARHSHDIPVPPTIQSLFQEAVSGYFHLATGTSLTGVWQLDSLTLTQVFPDPPTATHCAHAEKKKAKIRRIHHLEAAMVGWGAAVS